MEVAQQKAKPFMVDIDGKTTVQVLGTSFNINAYEDDGQIRTPLVEGSVKVLSETALSPVMLQPGQQALLRAGVKQAIAVASNVDMNRVLAWKNGYFSFDNLGLREVARQIERWYDIKVAFEANVGNMSLTGEMDRGVSLSGIQRFLQQYGFTTILENRVLTVSRK
jgi:ferric-dicitrate binding protein FerR (iron transport regulator)